MQIQVHLFNIKAVKFLLWVILVSYWYNMGVITYGAVGSNDLRLYDIAFLPIIYLFMKDYYKLKLFIKKNISLYRMFRFLKWASLLFAVTVYYCVFQYRIVWAFQSLMYLYHFWGFVIAAIYLKYIYTDSKDILYFLTVFMAIGLAEGLLIIAQHYGVVPILWAQRWIDAYGDDALTGTLGLNRVLPGLSMFLCFVIASVFLSNQSKTPFFSRLLAIAVSLVGLVVILLSGSRTSWVATIIFAVIVYIRNISLIITTCIAMVVFMMFPSLLPGTLQDKFDEVLENRVLGKMSEPVPGGSDDVDAGQLYDDLGANRDERAMRYIINLGDKIWIVPFGGGFNNRLTVGGDSAHNIYLTLIAEVGIVGVILYVSWLLSYFKVIKEHTLMGYNKIFDITALRALVIAMMITLLFGEHLYIYRPSYGFLGMFLMVTSLLINLGFPKDKIGSNLKV